MGDPLTRVVADADVLAADLVVGGAARWALDIIRSHSWCTLVASEPLLDDATCVIGTVTDVDLAQGWRSLTTERLKLVEHPEGDHPALATALHGDARHVLSFDDDLLSAAAGAAIRDQVETSVKHPDAFARLFDPESVYAVAVGGTYSGPDRDPRA